MLCFTSPESVHLLALRFGDLSVAGPWFPCSSLFWQRSPLGRYILLPNQSDHMWLYSWLLELSALSKVHGAAAKLHNYLRSSAFLSQCALCLILFILWPDFYNWCWHRSKHWFCVLTKKSLGAKHPKFTVIILFIVIFLPLSTWFKHFNFFTLKFLNIPLFIPCFWSQPPPTSDHMPCSESHWEESVYRRSLNCYW